MTPPHPGAVTTLACLLPFVALGALWVVGALRSRRYTGSTSPEITLSCQDVLQLAGQEYDRDISSIVFCWWWTKRPLDWAELTDACRGAECRQRGELVAHPLPKPTFSCLQNCTNRTTVFFTLSLLLLTLR